MLKLTSITCSEIIRKRLQLIPHFIYLLFISIVLFLVREYIRGRNYVNFIINKNAVVIAEIWRRFIDNTIEKEDTITIQFGQSRLTYTFIIIDIIQCIFIVVPFVSIVSYIHKRILVRYIPSIILQSSTLLSFYCSMSYIFIGDIFLDIWLSSISQVSSSTSTIQQQSQSSSETNATPTIVSFLVHQIQLLLNLNLYSRGNNNISISSDNTNAILVILSSFQQIDTCIILLIRFLFIILGVYIGQKLVFVALTGSIATGKSTVGKMFVSLSSSNNNNHNSNSNSFMNNDTCNNNDAINSTNSSSSSVIVHLIDSDRIGHEILLPPSLIGTSTNNLNSLVLPSESVYYKIVQTFGDATKSNDNLLEMNNDTDSTNTNSTSTIERKIDRTKLGTIIFSNNTLRTKLNSITHPRIIYILLKNMIQSAFVLHYPWNRSIIIVDVPLLFENNIMKLFFSLIIVVGYTNDNNNNNNNESAHILQYDRLRQRNSELTNDQCWERINSQLSIEYKMKHCDIIIYNNSTTTLDQLQQQVQQILYSNLLLRLYGFFPTYQYITIIGIYYIILILLY